MKSWTSALCLASCVTMVAGCRTADTTTYSRPAAAPALAPSSSTADQSGDGMMRVERRVVGISHEAHTKPIN